MRIAQVAPLFESVPPKLYGGTELVVSSLTEELVRQGHDVTLFAAGDSVTSARLVPCSERSLRLDPTVIDHIAHHVVMLEQVFQRAEEFDLIHFHCDYLHYPFSRRRHAAHVTTLHGRLDIPDLQPLYREFPEMPVISISNAQREPLPWINWVGTVHHGMRAESYEFRDGPGQYLAFLGRISPEKRPDRAIEIAVRAGVPLKIAAKIGGEDQDYFKSTVRPLLRNPLVEYVGEISSADKSRFLGNAMALLFPIDWPEPFGLVMIEAMACGTPVIAYPLGSVPEVIENGVTGFIVRSISEAVRTVGRIPAFDRRRCREAFLERFTSQRMARDYVAIYERILEGVHHVG